MYFIQFSWRWPLKDAVKQFENISQNLLESTCTEQTWIVTRCLSKKSFFLNVFLYVLIEFLFVMDIYIMLMTLLLWENMILIHRTTSWEEDGHQTKHWNSFRVQKIFMKVKHLRKYFYLSFSYFYTRSDIKIY